MSSELLIELLTQLDARQQSISVLDSYYQGSTGPAFLHESDREVLKKFDTISANVCRAAVVALQERLRVSGFTGPAGVFDLWTTNQLDQMHSAVAHRDALLYGGGGSYAVCWVGPDGKPAVSLENAKRVYAQRNPVTGQIEAAVKRVQFRDRSECWVYLSGTVEHWVSNNPSAANSAYRLADVLEHHLGVPPVVAIGLECDESVISDILSLQDSLNKYLLDSIIASEYAGRPRRFSVGAPFRRKPKLDSNGQPVIGDDGKPEHEILPPFDESNRLMATTAENAKIGQLPSADLSGFTDPIRTTLAMIEMSTGLPPHYMGQISTAAQPASSSAIRASEAGLVSRAEARQASIGPSWEAVMRILVAIRDGVPVDEVAAIRVKWSPADTRNRAEDADALLKLVQGRILPATYALQELGYDDDEIAKIRAARRAETLDAQGVDLDAVEAA